MSDRLRLVLGVAAMLGGCHLVDQRTFVVDADKPPKLPIVPVPPPPPPSPALVVIRFPAEEDWHDTLRVAVGLALQRKADVLFTVQSASPRQGTPAQQAEALSRAAGDARTVGEAIVADGADRSQVELTAASDPAATREEVRIFVR